MGREGERRGVIPVRLLYFPRIFIFVNKRAPRRGDPLCTVLGFAFFEDSVSNRCFYFASAMEKAVNQLMRITFSIMPGLTLSTVSDG